MKHGFILGALALCGATTVASLALGQQEPREQQESRSQRDSDAGVRVRYDDEEDRFSLDVSGVGQDLRQWWQSWWEDEGRTSRSVSEGAELGARSFLRQHDRNDDGYLSRRELPEGARDEFRQADRNDDDYLSRSEVRQFGEQLYGSQRRSTGTGTQRDSSRTASRQAQRDSRQAGHDEQSWSQWWSSWWSDDQQGQDREQRGSEGARQFVRQHDNDDDGYISRSELPQRMRDQFVQIDRNDDEYLSSSEIRQAGLAQSGRSRQSQSRQSQSGQSQSGQSQSGQSQSASVSRSSSRSGRGQSEYRSSSQQGSRAKPVEVAYVWVIDANQGTVQLEDLQKAYEVLSEIDANSDGRLSRSELKEQHQQAVSQWCEECFTQLDEDSDDRLSREEAQSSVFASRFDSLDRNSDQSLTEDEIRRSMQQQFEARTDTSDDDETRR